MTASLAKTKTILSPCIITYNVPFTMNARGLVFYRVIVLMSTKVVHLY